MAMHHVVNTPPQARAVLRALRQSRGLTQAQLGVLLGISQKRIARLEATPGVTGFDQIARLVAALGARLIVDDGTATDASLTPPTSSPSAAKRGRRKPAKPRATAKVRGTW